MPKISFFSIPTNSSSPAAISGENFSRPQSEIKASTPVEKPPPPPQSAPPELSEQVKMDGKL